jgi:hypothetical protein
MKGSLKKVQAWRCVRHQRREQRSLEWWERERANGKTRFVIRSALTYGLTTAGVSDLIQRVVFGEANSLLFNLISFMVAGIVMGSTTWSTMDAKYDDALRKGCAKALPDSQTPPQSDQGVSKA